MPWLTAFLDLPADEHAEASAFWAAVTGYAVSQARGASDEHTTLLPPEGDPYLKLQRLGEGGSRLHLDVTVPDPAQAALRAEGLGASVVSREDGYVVLMSPGGFVLCLVAEGGERRPRPAAWPGGPSAADQVCLDVPPAAYVRETEFWTALTGWAFEAHEDPQFDSLARPASAPLRILFQRLEDEQDRVGAHLDLSSADRAAETARHEALGAQVLSVHEEWTVMRPPAGIPYCVTDRTP
ncbi:VOC family protein [Nocardioides lijunqiniae]|uniref:VOC family protein n=1 Tax=Nocardioides lijunqiniae TaxID=2760832 RepID=UPI001878DEBA|nr:VOC family protein [Nocardioides lijunqiniae]